MPTWKGELTKERGIEDGSGGRAAAAAIAGVGLVAASLALVLPLLLLLLFPLLVVVLVVAERVRAATALLGRAAAGDFSWVAGARASAGGKGHGPKAELVVLLLTVVAVVVLPLALLILRRACGPTALTRGGGDSGRSSGPSGLLCKNAISSVSSSRPNPSGAPPNPPTSSSPKKDGQGSVLLLPLLLPLKLLLSVQAPSEELQETGVGTSSCSLPLPRLPPHPNWSRVASSAQSRGTSRGS